MSDAPGFIGELEPIEEIEMIEFIGDESDSEGGAPIDAGDHLLTEAGERLTTEAGEHLLL